MTIRTYVSGLIIDTKGTLDPDDSIGAQRTAQGYIITVSITDLTRSIKPQGKLFRRALTLGRTHYNTQLGNVYMLSEQLATEQLCLQQGRKRKVVSVQFRFDHAFRLTGRRLVLGYLRARRSLSYLEAGQILEDQRDRDHDELVILSMAAKALTTLRTGRRSSDWLPDARNLASFLDRKGLLPIEVRPARIVEEMMLAYGLYVAKFAYSRDIPIIYRGHSGRPSDYAFYTCHPTPHGMIGCRLYAHSGSPLRRVPDLINQFQVTAAICRNKPLFDRQRLDCICAMLRQQAA